MGHRREAAMRPAVIPLHGRAQGCGAKSRGPAPQDYRRTTKADMVAQKKRGMRYGDGLQPGFHIKYNLNRFRHNFK